MAYNFDGSSDYLFSADNALLDITGALTIFAKIKTSSSNAGIFAKYTGSGNQRSYGLATTSGEFDFTISPNGKFNSANSVKGSSPSGSWQNVCGVFNPSTQQELFVDGVSAATHGGTPEASIHSGTAELTIGRWFGASNYLNGDIAECALWSANLSDSEVGSLNDHSPRLVRPQSLVFHASLVRETVDIINGLSISIGSSPTVTAHPRIIYPRRTRLVLPPPLAARVATGEHTLSIGQSAALAALIKAGSTQTFSIGQTASGDVKVKATAGQSLAVGQSTAAKLLLKASGAQSLGIGQAASAGLIAKSAAAQSLAIGQVAFVGDLPGFTAAQSLQIGQSALADLSNLFVTGTDILDLPVDCVLAGQQEQFRERIREFDIRPRNMKTRGTFGRSRLATLSNQKPTFKVTTNKTGRD